MRCLLIGGAGPVGTAALYLMNGLGWSAWVVDSNRPFCQERHVHNLQRTIEQWTERDYALDDLREMLKAERFDLVIDLTPTLDKRQTIEVCDELGISLVNSTMVCQKQDTHVVAFDFLHNRPRATHCPHLVASGMNPGAINAMAEEIVAQNGKPDAIVFWEYDDTLPSDGMLAGPSTTWCPDECGAELADDWSFEVVPEGSIILHETALRWHPQDYRSCGVPMERLRIPPEADAMLIGHEECMYMGWRHDTAVKFVYGFHPKNMKLIRAARGGYRPNLLLQNPQRPLVGRDIVGVACRYLNRDGWVGSYSLLENTAEIPPDTNATCWLVAAGVIASGVYMKQHTVQPGVHLTHELPGWMETFRALVPQHSYELRAEEVTAETPPLL